MFSSFWNGLIWLKYYFILLNQKDRFSFRGNQAENSEFICICEARWLCNFFLVRRKDGVKCFSRICLLFKHMTQKCPEILTPNSFDLSFLPINSVLLFFKILVTNEFFLLSFDLFSLSGDILKFFRSVCLFCFF